MIDNKPFRVTNEQVKAMAKCCGTPCSECSINGDICNAFHREDLATDLLDARELIDKQEAIIKEMYKQLYQIRSKFDASDIECNDAYICITNVNEIISILEKTKDYVD